MLTSLISQVMDQVTQARYPGCPVWSSHCQCPPLLLLTSSQAPGLTSSLHWAWTWGAASTWPRRCLSHPAPSCRGWRWPGPARRWWGQALTRIMEVRLKHSFIYGCSNECNEGVCDSGGEMSDQMIWWQNANTQNRDEQEASYDEAPNTEEEERPGIGHHHLDQLKRVIFDHVSQASVDMKRE